MITELSEPTSYGLATLTFGKHRHAGTVDFLLGFGEWGDTTLQTPFTAHKRCKHCWTPMNFTQREYTKIKKAFKKSYQPPNPGIEQ